MVLHHLCWNNRRYHKMISLPFPLKGIAVFKNSFCVQSHFFRLFWKFYVIVSDMIIRLLFFFPLYPICKKMSYDKLSEIYLSFILFFLICIIHIFKESGGLVLMYFRRQSLKRLTFCVKLSDSIFFLYIFHVENIV